MKIRLLEPNSPSMHLWSHSYFVRLGLPPLGLPALGVVGLGLAACLGAAIP